MHKCDTCQYKGEHQEMGFKPCGVCTKEHDLIKAMRAYMATECPFAKKVELEPCPFCGGEAYIREYANGHSGGGKFSASYECGCSKCKIAFKANSEFELKNGFPVFTVNGYEKCMDAWNRRATDEERNDP